MVLCFVGEGYIGFKGGGKRKKERE